MPQGLFKPNGSRFWGLKACLSETGQGFGACVHQGLFKGFGASRQAGQSSGSEGLFPLATSTIYIGEFKPNGSDLLPKFKPNGSDFIFKVAKGAQSTLEPTIAGFLDFKPNGSEFWAV